MSIRIPVALAALLAVAACDPQEPVEITEREAVGMLQTIIGVMEDVEVFEAGDVDMASCPEGGTATVEVISYIEPRGDTVLFDDMVSIKPSACRMSLAESTTFTVDGAPDVRLHIEGWILDSEDFSLEWRLFGAFTWDKGSEGGAKCEVGLDSKDVRLDEHTGLIDGTFQGGLCGFDVIVEWDELGPES